LDNFTCSEENKTYASGRKREATKNIIERRKRDAKGRFEVEDPVPQPEAMDEAKQERTSEKQAKEEGVSHWKIEENAKFAKGVDLISCATTTLPDLRSSNSVWY
jgi:hypothetical protein